MDYERTVLRPLIMMYVEHAKRYLENVSTEKDVLSNEL